jgi:hypothetical protein
MEALARQAAAFMQKVGRKPEPDDLIFFDPEADEPQSIGDSVRQVEKLEGAMLRAMVQAGIRPQLIHAWRRTGFLATEENWERLTHEQRAEWVDALAEYDELTRRAH